MDASNELVATVRSLTRQLRQSIVAAAVVLLLIFVAALLTATPARAATHVDRPATRSDVARIIVERGLLADVTPNDRLNLWQGSECAADLDAVGYYQRRRICYVMALGFMGDTGRNAAYPVFEPHEHITRAQAASVVQRLATQESVRMPAHAAVFIDVKRRSTHERAIRFGAYHGLINGFDTSPATFRPDAPLTVRHARALVDRVVDHWRHGAAR